MDYVRVRHIQLPSYRRALMVIEEREPRVPHVGAPIEDSVANHQPKYCPRA